MQLIICPDSVLCSTLDLLQLILLRYSSAQLAFCSDTVCKVGGELLDSSCTVLFAAHLVSLTKVAENKLALHSAGCTWQRFLPFVCVVCKATAWMHPVFIKRPAAVANASWPMMA